MSLKELQLAALLHDIGKFWWRFLPEKFSDINEWWEGERVPHQVLSEQFVELLDLPKGIDKNLVKTLTLKHHDSAYTREDLRVSSLTGYERTLARIVDVADNLSSEERIESEESETKKPLISIFSEIRNVKNASPSSETATYYYLPQKISLDCIPQKAQKDWNPTSSEKEEIYNRLSKLWNEFLEEARNIRDDNFETYFETLYYTLEKYTRYLPSAGFKSVPDISLFDHLKTTTAIATCLYRYRERYDVSISDKNTPRFLLIGGDISGIQEFIYNISSKGAAKSLKGRSLYLQLLTEAIAKYILDKLELPVTNLLYCGGGHFYILAPITDEEKLKNMRAEIGRILLKYHEGELHLILSWISLAGKDFEDFSKKWDEISERISKEKKTKFSGLLSEQYNRIFNTGVGKEKVCEICGSERNVIEDKEEGEEKSKLKCRFCRSFEDLAKKASNFRYLVEILRDKEIRMLEEGTWENVLNDFGYRYAFEREINESIKRIDADKITVYSINSTEMPMINANSPVSYGFKFMAKKTPLKSGEIKSFDDFSEESDGVKRWAVLRMDVDDLGRIFAKGLGEDRSISRISTLSSMLSFYFGAFVDEIANEYENAYVIYSGGDDLFIVASWNILPNIAKRIYKKFREFTCHNENITLSAGIYISPSTKFPLYKAANRAGEFLDDAKDLNGKDGISFLQIPFKWREFEKEIEPLKEKLISLIDGNGIPRALLQKMYMIYSEYEKQKSLHGRIQAKYDNRYGRWRWLSAYLFSGLKRQYRDLSDDLENLYTQILSRIDYLHVATRWAEILTRRD